MHKTLDKGKSVAAGVVDHTRQTFAEGVDMVAGKNPEDGRRFAIAFLLILVCVLLVVILVMGAALASALPLRREVPYFVHYAADQRTLISVSRLNTENNRLEDIAKRLAADYVRMRHEIVPDQDEMDRRWEEQCLRDANLDSSYCGYLATHSMPAVYKQFSEETAATKDIINRFIAEGRIRRIEFGDNEPKRRSYYPNAANGAPAFEFEIDFMMIDSVYDAREMRNQEILRQAFTATITCALIGQADQPPYERFINPLGFKVNRYLITRRNG